jgi:acyl-CoA thioester hydrolase
LLQPIETMKDSSRNQSAEHEPRGARRFDLRVYYEDTDFSGLVYHASYLRFLERARTEWLRGIGLEQGNLKQGEATTFAVRRIEIDYLRPAKMDDALTVETRITRVGGASVDFEQTIARGAEKLVAALVGVAMLRNGRPARIPVSMKARILEAIEKDRPAGATSDAANLQRPVEPRDD